MNYKKFLEEAAKEAPTELNKVFIEALAQVFSQRYLREISQKIGDFIDIKEVYEKKGIVAYNVGTRIFINKNEFYNFSVKAQARYLLHEFIHVLQRKGGLLGRFKDIRILTNSLEKILKEHLTQPLSVFLTGKNQNLGSGGKWEIISYFMNNSIDWRAIDDEGKAKIVSEIKSSGIFNTSSPFWKRRLPY